MALTLQIKRSTGSTIPGTLADGELIYTHGNEKFYIGDGSTVKVIGGKSFNDKLDHTDGTLTASSAVLVDANSAIDDFIIGNNATTGGALKIKEGTNNGSHHVQLKSPNSLSGNVEFTLPSADGSADQFLKTNGSGTLSFGTISSSFTLAGQIVVQTIHSIRVRHLHLLVVRVLTQLYQIIQLQSLVKMHRHLTKVLHILK